jgi:spermidine synthase
VDVVEINPGYYELIAQYPEVSSLLRNPKVHIYTDDARRWLIAHPDARYDVVLANSTYFWRDHSSHLLSVEFMQQVRKHLGPGGVYIYNTTSSDDALATGLRVFPYGLRIVNLLAVSDSPIRINKDRWLDVLHRYQIDGHPTFDPRNPETARLLQGYMAFADTAQYAPRFVGMEYSASLNARLTHNLIFTEDNMGWEWRSASVQIPWH